MASPKRAKRAPESQPRPASAAPAPSSPRPPKKPMAMARRVSLFERQVTVRLAPAAVDLLHGAARVLSEGELAGEVYAGSTMMTVDLARTTDRISDAPDALTARRVAQLYAADERCRAHARRVAIAEARRLAGCELVPTVDVESRAHGSELHLSVNVEAKRRPR